MERGSIREIVVCSVPLVHKPQNRNTYIHMCVHTHRYSTTRTHSTDPLYGTLSRLTPSQTFQYPIKFLYSLSIRLVQFLEDVYVFELTLVLALLSAKEYHSNEVSLATDDLVQQNSAGTLE